MNLKDLINRLLGATTPAPPAAGRDDSGLPDFCWAPCQQIVSEPQPTGDRHEPVMQLLGHCGMTPTSVYLSLDGHQQMLCGLHLGQRRRQDAIQIQASLETAQSEPAGIEWTEVDGSGWNRPPTATPVSCRRETSD